MISRLAAVLLLTTLISITMGDASSAQRRQTRDNARNSLSDRALEFKKIDQICRRYEHCNDPTLKVSVHKQQLIQMLKNRILEPSDIDSKIDVASMSADLRSLEEEHQAITDPAEDKAGERKLLSRQIASIEREWTKREAISKSNEDILLPLCKKYHHCSDFTVDTRHCYELEGAILKRENQIQNELHAKTGTERRALEQQLKCIKKDLQVLKKFGAHIGDKRGDWF